MDVEITAKHIWTKFILKLKSQNPFFANLAMFAEFDLSEDLDWAQTDGKRIGIAAQLVDDYSERELHGLLLHQVLHLALSHGVRGMSKNHELWNVAADIVVNNIIHEAFGWPAAPATAWNFNFTGSSADKVYAILLRESEKREDCCTSGEPNVCETASPSDDHDSADDIDDTDMNSSKSAIATHSPGRESAKKYKSAYDLVAGISPDEAIATEEYWRHSLISVERSHQAGDISASLTREWTIAAHPQLNWRTILWRFVSPTRDDYSEFDNRFVHQGVYLEVLQCESIVVDVVIDTSGSVSQTLLSAFLTELVSIKAHFPHVLIKLFYCDSQLSGPFDLLVAQENIPVPIGGGGTNFDPYFSELRNADLVRMPVGVVYFTDGFATFPDAIPAIDVLWVIPDYGIDEETVPFGTVIRI